MEWNLPQRSEVRQAFNDAAERYDRHAALEQEAASRLLERLEYQRRPADRIVDLGCGTGHACAELKKRNRKAQVIGLDSSRAMLAQTQNRSGLLRPLKLICADFAELPLADRSVDLVFSNLAFQWCTDPTALFNEIRRVLAPGGMLLFTSLGVGTLNELASAWESTHETARMAPFIDILELGDALMAAGFQEPVMDAERISLNYPDISALLEELDATGMTGFLRGARDSHASRLALKEAYEPFKVNDRYPVSFELVYGTAYGPEDGQPRKTAQGDVVTFSVDALRKTKPAKT
jgi:malonyl-CoA O-methyltransferase